MPGDDREGDSAPPSAYTTIARIARVLGCSTESLIEGTAEPLDMRGASELLSLWVELNDEADRERLLTFARDLARARAAAVEPGSARNARQDADQEP